MTVSIALAQNFFIDSHHVSLSYMYLYHVSLKNIPRLQDFSGSCGDHPEHFGLDHVLATVSHSSLDLHLDGKIV